MAGPYLNSNTVTAAAFIGGVRRLVSGYSGHAVQLQRGDGTTADFDFGADDALDASAINSWNAANSGGPGGIGIRTLYDQSGNGNNLVQTTSSLQPFLEVTGYYQASAKSTEPTDGQPCIYLHQPVSPSVTDGYWDCATGTFSNQTFSFIAAGRHNTWFYTGPPSVGDSGVAVQMDLSVNNNCIVYTNAVQLRVSSGNFQAWLATRNCGLGGSLVSTPTTSLAARSMWVPNSSYTAQAVRASGGRVTCRIGNWRSGSMGGGISATGLTGFRVGRSFGTAFGCRHVSLAFVLTTTALSTADEQNAMDVMAAHWGFTNSPDTLLVAQGDSITSSLNTTLGSNNNRTGSWFWSVARSLGSRVVAHNFAESSQYIGNLATPYGMLTGQSGAPSGTQFGPAGGDCLDTMLDSNYFRQQVLVLFGGITNDLYYFLSGTGVAGLASEVHARFRQFCLARRAAGWKVIVCNSIPRSQFDGTAAAAEWGLCNDLIRRTWREYADDFVDVAAINWLPNNSYSTYYQDGVHPNAAGQALLAAAILPVVRRNIDPVGARTAGRQTTGRARKSRATARVGGQP